VANKLDSEFAAIEPMTLESSNPYTRLDVSTTSASVAIGKGTYIAILTGVDTLQIGSSAIVTPASGATSATTQRAIQTGYTVIAKTDTTIHAATISGSGVLLLQKLEGAS
jgi:hypothetical protein